MSDLVQTVLKYFPMDRFELISIISTAGRRYKTYKIPKRSGNGFRTIAQPAPEVKRIQRIVVEKVIGNWPIHEAATAYRKGFSIRNHAALHSNSKYLLKLDFSDFFPSISLDAVRRHIAKHSILSEQDSIFLASILTWLNKQTGARCLSIGAPSSPFVSNSMMFDFDAALYEYCVERGVVYSRYADDLAFSTNQPKILADIERFAHELVSSLSYPRLRFNETKTVNVSKRDRRVLVGLNITPEGGVSIGRERKRLVRAQVNCLAKGLPFAGDVSSLRGTLAFIWSVEPAFIRTLLEKYGDDVFISLDLPFRRG